MRDCGKHEISIFPHLDHQAQERIIDTGVGAKGAQWSRMRIVAMVAPLQGLGDFVPGDPPHGEVQDLGNSALLVRIPGIEYDVKERSRHSKKLPSWSSHEQTRGSKFPQRPRIFFTTAMLSGRTYYSFQL